MYIYIYVYDIHNGIIGLRAPAMPQGGAVVFLLVVPVVVVVVVVTPGSFFHISFVYIYTYIHTYRLDFSYSDVMLI